MILRFEAEFEVPISLDQPVVAQQPIDFAFLEVTNSVGLPFVRLIASFVAFTIFRIKMIIPQPEAAFRSNPIVAGAGQLELQLLLLQPKAFNFGRHFLL